MGLIGCTSIRYLPELYNIHYSHSTHYSHFNQSLQWGIVPNLDAVFILIFAVYWRVSSQERTTVCVRRCTKPRLEQAKKVVAEEIGEEPSNADVIEELVQAYLGNEPLGEWRDDE